MYTAQHISCFERDNLSQIVDILTDSGLILYPTDTVWGIGCNACDPVAVERVFQLKERDRSQKFVLLVHNMDMLRQYVKEVHPRLDTLLSFHERPLTVVYNRAKNLPNNAVADDGSIAIRVVRDPFCKALIGTFGKPLIATTANVSDTPCSTHFGEISSTILQGVDYVARHRQHEKTPSEPSIIVRVSGRGDLDFLRE